MELKKFYPGDLVSLKTRERLWEGIILESYDPEIILLKLKNGYNIGIRESEIVDAKLIRKAEKVKKKAFSIKKNPSLRNVALVITGGTISSRLDPKTGGVIPTDKEEILNIAPKINEICNIVRIEKPFLKLSEDLSFKDWKKLAESCVKFLNDPSVDGIIVTHGTDFLHYSSAALSYFIRNLNKPIAFTFSQRSIDRGSTDASLNLICAAKYAVSDIAEVAVVGHKNSSDEACLAMPGEKVRKLHTSRRDAFKVINGEPIAEISVSDFKILREFNAKDSRKKAILDAKYLNKVAQIKIYPGQDSSILDYYYNEGYKGIILEVAGLGHVPGRNSESNWISKIKKIINKDVVICATAQTIFGRLNPNVYSSGRELKKTGIIFLDDMTSEAAFVKLGWVLGHKSWRNKIREKMLEKT